MESLAGQFLLASPQLLDPNFVHGVILMIQHDDQGALGLVLNRPTSKLVCELWQQVGESPCESQRPVHLGGPVSGPLMALHTIENLAEIEIVPGLFFAAKKQNLDQLVRRDEDRCKVFIGHAGWGPGQLENELAQGAWRVTQATIPDVFDDIEDLWQRLLRRAEGIFLPELLKIKHIPQDPTMN
jgi:putative transcriptional regulator